MNHDHAMTFLNHVVVIVRGHGRAQLSQSVDQLKELSDTFSCPLGNQ